MIIENTWTVSGTIKGFTDKSMREYNGKTQLNGWLSQRDTARLSNGDEAGFERYIVGMKITAKDPAIIKQLIELDNARQGQATTVPVTVTGRISQWVAKSKTGGADQFVYDLEVYNITVL